MTYLGKINFRASDYTATSAKKLQDCSWTDKGKLDASGLYASG